MATVIRRFLWGKKNLVQIFNQINWFSDTSRTKPLETYELFLVSLRPTRGCVKRVTC
jgi:hypothetical protein